MQAETPEALNRFRDFVVTQVSIYDYEDKIFQNLTLGKSIITVAAGSSEENSKKEKLFFLLDPLETQLVNNSKTPRVMMAQLLSTVLGVSPR